MSDEIERVMRDPRLLSWGAVIFIGEQSKHGVELPRDALSLLGITGGRVLAKSYSTT